MKKIDVLCFSLTVFFAFALYESVKGLRILFQYDLPIGSELGSITQALVEQPASLVGFFFGASAGLTMGIFWIIAIIKES